MHLSYRHALRLLLDQPLPQTVQNIRQAQLRRHKFRQFTIYGIEVDIHFIEASSPASSIAPLFTESAIKPGFCHWPDSRSIPTFDRPIQMSHPVPRQAKLPLDSFFAVYILSLKPLT